MIWVIIFLIYYIAAFFFPQVENSSLSNSLPKKCSMLIPTCTQTGSRLIRVDVSSCWSSVLRFIWLKSENIKHIFSMEQET